MPKDVFLSVVIPCFDEMANLQKGVLEKVVHFLNKKKFSYEVIIVDDGSKDNSPVFVETFIAENPHVALIKSKHLGKAGAVTTGMLLAKGQYVLFTDMDQATPIEEINKLLPFLEKEKFDIAIGSRVSGELGYPMSRLILHEAGIMLRKFIVGLPEISDTQCGFKLFTNIAGKEVFEKLKQIHNGFKEISNSAVQFGFDVEVLLIAKSKGYSVKEVPVSWLYVESRRVSPVRDSIDGILNLFSIRSKKLQNRY